MLNTWKYFSEILLGEQSAVSWESHKAESGKHKTTLCMAREGRRGGRSVVQRSRLLRDPTFVSISFSFFEMNLLIMWLFWYECWIFPFEHYNYINMLILSKLKILTVSNMRQLTCQFFNNWPKKLYTELSRLLLNHLPVSSHVTSLLQPLCPDFISKPWP